MERETTGLPYDVFISYRHQSADKEADMLWGHLKLLGVTRVFRDHNSLGAGEWPDQIAAALDDARIVLVVITKDWLYAITEATRRFRLDNENDPVRCEIELALENDATVIPVLFDGVEPPSEELLPESIKGLVKQQAYWVHDDQQREADIERLAGKILEKLGEDAGRGSGLGEQVHESARTSIPPARRSAGQMIDGRMWPTPAVRIDHPKIVGVLERDSELAVLVVVDNALRMEEESGRYLNDYEPPFELLSAVLSTSGSHVVLADDHQVVRVAIRGTSFLPAEPVELGHVGQVVAAWPGTDYLYLARAGTEVGPQLKISLRGSGTAIWEPDGTVGIRKDWLSVAQDDCELAVVDKDHHLLLSGRLARAFRTAPGSGWVSLDLANDGNDRKATDGVVAGLRVEDGQYWIHLAATAGGAWESFDAVPVIQTDVIRLSRSRKPGKTSVVLVEFDGATIGWRTEELCSAVTDLQRPVTAAR